MCTAAILHFRVWVRHQGQARQPGAAVMPRPQGRGQATCAWPFWGASQVSGGGRGLEGGGMGGIDGGVGAAESCHRGWWCCQWFGGWGPACCMRAQITHGCEACRLVAKDGTQQGWMRHAKPKGTPPRGTGAGASSGHAWSSLKAWGQEAHASPAWTGSGRLKHRA